MKINITGNQNKIKSVLVLLLFIVFQVTGLKAQTNECKCGPDCKCRVENKGVCKCGPDCKCAQTKPVCKCGPDCKCKTGDKSQCKCGPDCKCAQTVSACKCGPDCKCRKDNNGQCKCGPACKCAQVQGAEHQHGSDQAQAGVHQHGQAASQNAFLKMMDAMMVGMDSVTLYSSVERNFLVQMVPHHQGALVMARYEIEHGTNPEMIQLAKSILAEQQSEIMEMQAMSKSYPAAGDVAPDYKLAMDKTMVVMMEKTPKDSDLTANVDCSFAKVMLPHHQAAVDMAVALLRMSPKGQVATYAKRIISDQQIEIEQMSEYIKNQCKK